MYQIFYHPKVVSHDLPKISKSEKDRIQEAIESKLTIEPLMYTLTLRQGLKGYRKLRVGDYRIIFKIIGKKISILIIAHRSIVYDRIIKRI